jgi:hypothetical protein
MPISRLCTYIASTFVAEIHTSMVISEHATAIDLGEARIRPQNACNLLKLTTHAIMPAICDNLTCCSNKHKTKTMCCAGA